MLRRLGCIGATSLEAAHLANFSFSSAGARRVWPSRVVQVLVLVVPGLASARQAPLLHCTAGTVQPALHCPAPAVSLAPSPPHSSSPALLAAIAKPRAGIHIQLDAQLVDAKTQQSPTTSCCSHWRPLQYVFWFALGAGGLLVWAERWGVGLVGWAGVPQPQPCPTLAGGAHRLTSGHNSSVSCVRCSTLNIFSTQYGQVEIKAKISFRGISQLMSGK